MKKFLALIVVLTLMLTSAALAEGTVRISLANLNAEDYTEIARRLFELLDDYADEYEQEAMKDAA